MYVAGLYLPEEKAVECLAASSVFVYFMWIFRKQRYAFKSAGEKGGKLKPKSASLIGTIATFVPPIAMLPPVLVYLVAVPMNGGGQPAFIARQALPDFGLDMGTINVLRIAGCLSMIGVWKLFSYIVDYLGQNFHGIGVRERPKLVSTGPYAIVRHPLYTVTLLQEFVLALVSWNYVPLYAFAALAISLAVKIPIEEGIIESDPDIGLDYVEYKRKVRFSLVPGIW